MRFSWTLALGLIAGITLAAPIQAQQHHWRIQGYVGDSFKVNVEFRKWAEQLKAKSGDQISIELLPVNAVIPATDGLDALKNGILSGVFQGGAYSAAKDPAFAIQGDTLAAYDTADQRYTWWHEGGGKELMRKLYAEHGGVVIGPVYTPAQVIPSKVPLNGVEDFKGLKIRGASGGSSALFTLMGAGTVVLPATELFNALQTGVIDATSWGWYALNKESGLYTVTKYSVDAHHSMATVEIVVSQRAWDKLSDELKALLETEVEAFSQHMRAIYQEDDAASKAAIQADGVTVIEWDPAEYAKMRELTMTYWDEQSKLSPMAKEMVDSHRAYIAKLQSK